MEATILVLLSALFLLAIVILYLITLRSGAPSVITDRDTRRSNNMNKRKEVRQQSIIKY